ncbi:hypothetical protein COOONC_02306 [Cooperia oncophora]
MVFTWTVLYCTRTVFAISKTGRNYFCLLMNWCFLFLTTIIAGMWLPAYYFTCNNIPAAKNFINKIGVDENSFRPRESYLWHYEPKMYIGMQYCRVGVRMAEEFLREASCIRSCDPVIMHERGSYYYIAMANSIVTAEQFFQNALLAVLGTDSEDAEFLDSSAILNEQIDPFWQPLIASLGHVSRRLGKYKESINFHSKALLMNPIDWHSMASMAMSYACLGETNIATRYFAKSLARAPYDGMVRNALDKLAQLENDYWDYTVFKTTSPDSNNDLERIFSERSVSVNEVKRSASDTTRSKKLLAEHAKSRLASRRMRQELARANTRKKIMDPTDQQ